MSEYFEKNVPRLKEHGIREWVDRSQLGRRFASRDPEVVDRICERIVEHGESIAKICKEKTVPDAPSVMTLMLWRKADARIDDAIRAAMEARAELRWDSIEEEVKAFFYDEDGQPVDPAQAKVMSHLARTVFDARRFEVSKLVPRTYGGDAPMPKSQLEKLMEEGKVQIVKYVEMPKRNEPIDTVATAPKELNDGTQRDRERMPVVRYADTSGVPPSK